MHLIFRQLLQSLATKFMSQGYGLLPNFGSKTPTWSSLRYKDYVKEGYKSLIWVYRCVREIGEAISSVPWQTFERASDGTLIPRPGNDLEKLLRKPNDIMNGPMFFETWAIYLLLSGNSFMEVVRKGENNDIGPPLELYPLRPDFMKVVPDPDNYISGYILDVQGRKIPFRPDEIVHWKFLDPMNEHVGMAPLQAGARIIDTENGAIGWNKAMLENAAQPSGALIVPEGKRLSPIQRLFLKEQIEQKFSRANAHRPMLLENGMRWEQMSISQRDMEFSLQRKMNALEICALFGVPPEVVGAGDRPKFENYEIARLSFWEETIVSLLEKLKSGINLGIAPLFGDNIEVNYDLSTVPAMRAAFTSKVKTALQLAELGYSLNQINTKLGLGFEEVPWGNEPLVNANLVPISLVLQAEEDGEEARPGAPRLQPRALLAPRPEDEEEELIRRFGAPMATMITKGSSFGRGMLQGYNRAASNGFGSSVTVSGGCTVH